MYCFVTDQRPSSTLPSGFQIDFYREELIRHHYCLRRQREYYSEMAYRSAEQALVRLLSQLEYVCRSEDAAQVMGHLLRQFDIVTNLSAWSDPKQVN
jgi:hypothetical protein